MALGSRTVLVGTLLMAGLGGACTPGYMKASELESRGQGPAACEKSCSDLGMRMAALVLVGDHLPGCVCQPLHVEGAPAAPAKAPEVDQGAAASTTGYVVLAAAAAARQQQEQQQRQQQQSYSQKH